MLNGDKMSVFSEHTAAVLLEHIDTVCFKDPLQLYLHFPNDLIESGAEADEVVVSKKLLAIIICF